MLSFEKNVNDVSWVPDWEFGSCAYIMKEMDGFLG